MLPKTHLLQLLPPRIDRALRRIEELIWEINPEPLPVYQAHSTADHRSLGEVTEESFKRIASTPHFWGRKFDQCWFRIELPALTSERHYLFWKDQGEATVYVDGVPYSGFDPGHRYCPIPRHVDTLYVESICCRTGVWVTGETQGITDNGSQFEGAFLAERNEGAWEAYHDLQVLMDVLEYEYNSFIKEDHNFTGSSHFKPPIERISPLFRKLLRRLDDAVDAFDNNGLPGFLPKLKAIYKDFPADAVALECVLTGHAHIDLVWLWPERVGDFKAIHTFSTVNRLMEQYPELRFGYSQPASYNAVERRAPKLMQLVKKRIEQGQWEATGASWVEADTQLACGENLARGFIIGQEAFAKLRGTPSTVLWLPDVFGYSPCLPQILQGTGVDYFFTTKLTWGTVTKFPYSSFRWLGHDGSEVVVHVTQAYGYNGDTNVRDIKEGAYNYRQADVHNAYLAPTGYGDGGGGPTEEMCERARRMHNLTSLPRVRWGRIESFFDNLATVHDSMPLYQGELYLECHRGVHTTHGSLKAAFRRCERSLQTLEAVHCLKQLASVEPIYWERLIYAQFHDYIPGSSIHEVYEEGEPELLALADKAYAAADEMLQLPGGMPCVFNPLPFAQTAFLDNDDETKLLRIPPLQSCAVDALEEIPIRNSVEVNPELLSNGRVRAVFDRQGSITSLHIDGKKVALAGKGGVLVTYRDHPSHYDAWDIDRPTLSNGVEVNTTAVVKIEEQKAHRAVLTFERQLMLQSRITVRYILEAESPVLKIEYEVDWQHYQALLKVRFPTLYNGRNARYGAPFGSILRVQQPGNAMDEAKFEVPASRYAIVCDDSEKDGLFIVTEAKYGFSCFQGDLALSLIRSALVTRAGVNRSLRDIKSEHDYSDIGHQTFRIAIGAYSAYAVREEQPAALAETLYTPLLNHSGEPMACGFLGLEGGDSLHPCWAKPCDGDGWILRLHETLGQRGSAQLLLESGWTAEVVNLMEIPVEKKIVDGVVAFGPYELISIRLKQC